MPKLREALLDAQYDLFQDGHFPVMILIAGVDGAGKGETVNLLNEWMDPRHINVAAFGEPSHEERERPPMWRYWRELPPRSRFALFDRSWYGRVLVDALRLPSRRGRGWKPNGKRYARIKVLKTICERLESAIKLQ